MSGTRPFVPGDRVNVVNFCPGPGQSFAGLPVLIVIRRMPNEAPVGPGSPFGPAPSVQTLQLSDGSIQTESSLVLVTPAAANVVLSYTTLADGRIWPTYVSG